VKAIASAIVTVGCFVAYAICRDIAFAGISMLTLVATSVLVVFE